MKRYFILSRGDEISDGIRQKLVQYLNDFNLVFDKEEPSIVISVGGDGTLLQAFHQYKHRLKDTAFLGLHTGHLGFYADWRPHEMEKLVLAIAQTPLETVEYPLLEVSIYQDNKPRETFLALNECTIKTTSGSIVMDVEINQERFETFRGDGLCISTPSGSTAYNKSLGGAIVHPTLSAIQLAEMASINNKVFRTLGAPIIIPKHHELNLKAQHQGEYLLTIDHLSFLEKGKVQLTCRVATERIRFARYRNFPFWKRVKESFIDE
jgi:NAD+ kinase